MNPARPVDHLSVEDLLDVAEGVVGEVLLRDPGALAAAAGRPRMTVFGAEAYPTFAAKAAALMHSLARNHPLVDGNERLSLAATIAFYGLNGMQLTLSNDEAYELVMAIASGELDDVAPIAERLGASTAPWR